MCHPSDYVGLEESCSALTPTRRTGKIWLSAGDIVSVAKLCGGFYDLPHCQYLCLTERLSPVGSFSLRVEHKITIPVHEYVPFNGLPRDSGYIQRYIWQMPRETIDELNPTKPNPPLTPPPHHPLPPTKAGYSDAPGCTHQCGHTPETPMKPPTAVRATPWGPALGQDFQGP